MAFYKHVRASAYGLKTNDVRRLTFIGLQSLAAERRILFIASWKLLRLCILQYLQRNDSVSWCSVRKFSFCTIYTVFRRTGIYSSMSSFCPFWPNDHSRISSTCSHMSSVSYFDEIYLPFRVWRVLYCIMSSNFRCFCMLYGFKSRPSNSKSRLLTCVVYLQTISQCYSALCPQPISKYDRCFSFESLGNEAFSLVLFLICAKR